MIKKVYSNKPKAGWHYRPDGWPCDKKGKMHRKYMSWGFDIHLRDASGTEFRKKESGFISAAEATIAADNFKRAQLRTRYGIPQLLPSPTLAQLVEKHLPRIAAPRERVRATRILSGLLKSCGKSLPVNELHTSHLDPFVDWLKSTGVGPSTIDRDLNIVSTMLHKGPDYFPALSQWRSPKLPRPRVSKRRRERVVKLEEFTKLITWLLRPREDRETELQAGKRRNVAHVFRMCLLTASRKGEMCRLRWDQIDWRAGTFQLIGTKTEFSQATTARYPKITDTIASIFRERWQWQHSGRVHENNESKAEKESRSVRSGITCRAGDIERSDVYSDDGDSAGRQEARLEKDLRSGGQSLKRGNRQRNPIRIESNRSVEAEQYVFTSRGTEVTDYYKIIKEAAVACGLLYGRKTLGGFVTHDNRHTAVSYLLSLGYDLKAIGELTGHSDETMVMLYSHVNRKTIVAAYDDLEKFAGTGTLGIE